MALGDFISEDDLSTFPGYLRYQGVDLATFTPDELRFWRTCFEEAMERRKNSSPKVGLMKLKPVAGEQKYAVVIQEGSDHWITLWVRCSPSGEIFIMYPRPRRRDEMSGDSHASYHLDGKFHQKSYGRRFFVKQLQPLTAAFSGFEYLGVYAGHGTRSIGAIYDPRAFTGAVIVEEGILAPHRGAVAVDLVAPGCESLPTFHGVQHSRTVFPRHGRPSVVITVGR